MTRTLHAAAAAALLAALAACGSTGTKAPEPMSADTAAGTAMAPGLASRAPAHAPIVEGQPVRVVGYPDQIALLDSPDPTLARNKRAAFDLWRSVLNAGHVEVADELMQEDYIQHSPVAGTGRDAFKEFFSRMMEPQEIPETIQSDLVSIVAEGDYVVFAFARELDDPANPGETYTTTWFDMFRMEDGKLAEHWDIATLPPGMAPIPVSDGGPLPVTGVTGPDQLALLESDDPVLAHNKKLVFDMWRGLVDAHHPETAVQYLNPDYIQHNPNAATGRDGVIAYFSTQPEEPIQPYTKSPLIQVVAEGDLVVLAFVRELPVPGSEDETYTTTWFDMFRLEGDRVAEHWDIATKFAPPAS